MPMAKKTAWNPHRGGVQAGFSVYNLKYGLDNLFECDAQHS